MASVESCCFHGYVGVDPIANELKSVVYPTLSNKEKKNMRYQEKLLRPTIFNLGVGLIESDPEKATGLLLQRELPQVYDAAKKPHEAIFLPHKFVFPKGVAAKAIVKSSGRHVLNSESQKIVSKFDPTLEGSQEEENIYNKFKATIKEHDKNIVVINGWKDNGSEKREQREYDFLIISEPYKTIIHIEAKTAMTKGSIGKAGLQLKSGLDFFQTVIPLPALQNWQYIRVMAFAKQASFTPCKDCELFVLGPDTNIETWWKNLKESQMVNSSERDPITYENIMKYLLHLMFRQNDPITETALLDHTIETTDEMTAFFWSSIQYSILKEPDNKRVALISPFGTGKTSLLKEKAKMLSKDGKRVTYIILSDTAETLLKCQVEEELKMIRNIKVLCKTIKELHTEKHFIELVQDYPDTNFFLDEVLVGYGGIDPDVLNKFAELVDTKHHIWFACQNQQPPHPSVLQAYLTPEMNVPLRYSKNLLETCQKHSEEIGGTRKPFIILGSDTKHFFGYCCHPTGTYPET